MTSRHTTALLALMLSTGVHAQNITPEGNDEDPINAAIKAFNDGVSAKSNEVTVVLPPPATEKPAEKAEDDKKPVLVTGKPPADSSLIDDEGSIVPPVIEEKPTDKRGLQVRVATIEGGKKKIDTSKVRLLAPFPPKALTEVPAGWHMETSDSAPPFTRKVEIMPGKTITLTIPPHILIPDQDGAEIFAVSEPGYENSLGYIQESTVSAVLANSIESLDRDSEELSKIIDQLDQLLVSLPKAGNTVKSESKSPNSK